jgi:hypothetical protein
MMSKEQANAIYDVLIEHAGASEWLREQFVFLHVNGRVDEFRFMGSLGSGGKFWRHYWSVTCYPEDATQERLETMARTDKALAKIRESYE